MAETKSELPVISFVSDKEWEQWLEENGSTSKGLWIKMAKKESGIVSINHPQALDVALCFGWIDGQRLKFDGQYFLQKFTPRRSKSMWSKVNQDKVATLIAAGRMREAGLKEIERAKADGRWAAAYESQSKMAVPDDLQAALDQNPAAKAFFDSLNSVNRYAILYRITTAKKTETRQKRLEKFITMLNEGKKIYD
ncbi:MAG: hypothetical protein GC179_20205 [Anaerolineaceae bacterium]|nr:hypothetical protein [Anaerolineaceae bacterium]